VPAPWLRINDVGSFPDESDHDPTVVGAGRRSRFPVTIAARPAQRFLFSSQQPPRLAA
jgi:hypothetical protein